MDEKVMISKNALDATFKKQVEKRMDAPTVTDAAANTHVAALVASAPAAAAGKFDDFFAAWETYYPRVVSLLGWASWVLPPATINIIKALLATINNQILPILKQILK